MHLFWIAARHLNSSGRRSIQQLRSFIKVVAFFILRWIASTCSLRWKKLQTARLVAWLEATSCSESVLGFASLLQAAAYGEASLSIVGSMQGLVIAANLPSLPILLEYYWQLLLRDFIAIFCRQDVVLMQPLTLTKKKKGWMCEWGIEDDVKQAVYHHIHCAYATCKFTFCTYTKHCKCEIPDCFQSSLRRCCKSSSLSFPCLCVL